MKIDSQLMQQLIIQRLDENVYTCIFDKKKDTLRVVDNQLGKGVTLGLLGIVGKYQEAKEQAIEEVIYYITETFGAMKKEKRTVNLNAVYPLIRAASFPTENKDGRKLITEEHTAETRIYYGEDLGNTYRLLDGTVVENIEEMKQIAKTNLMKLPTMVKEDQVANNTFYFFRANDGYDASRILNEEILQTYEQKIIGDMVVAIPHQDVFIIGDIKNEAGYDILSKMNIHFFHNGRIPITSLSFIYEAKELEPIFILGK